MNKVICLFFGHEYYLAQKLTEHSRRICCSRCHQSFAMNDDSRLVVDWSHEFHQLYESLGIKIEYKPEEYK